MENENEPSFFFLFIQKGNDPYGKIKNRGLVFGN